VRNALRYFPAEQHAQLAPEFAAELKQYGHIYIPTTVFSFSFYCCCFNSMTVRRYVQIPPHPIRNEGLPHRLVPREMQASSSHHVDDHEQPRQACRPIPPRIGYVSIQSPPTPLPHPFFFFLLPLPSTPRNAGQQSSC
jgi:hypothetical protein